MGAGLVVDDPAFPFEHECPVHHVSLDLAVEDRGEREFSFVVQVPGQYPASPFVGDGVSKGRQRS